MAWNEVVKEFVNSQIKPYFNGNTGLISLFIYAIVITALAVIVTFELTLLVDRLERKREAENK